MAARIKKEIKLRFPREIIIIKKKNLTWMRIQRGILMIRAYFLLVRLLHSCLETIEGIILRLCSKSVLCNLFTYQFVIFNNLLMFTQAPLSCVSSMLSSTTRSLPHCSRTSVRWSCRALFHFLERLPNTTFSLSTYHHLRRFFSLLSCQFANTSLFFPCRLSLPRKQYGEAFNSQLRVLVGGAAGYKE